MNDRKHHRIASLRWMGYGAIVMGLMGGLGGTGAGAVAPVIRVSQQAIAQTRASAAQAAYNEADRLYKHQTAESLRQAIIKLEEARQLFRAEKNINGEATSLLGIGNVYNALGEKQKALNYYNQSLPLRRAVGDRAGETTTLYSIAYVFRNQGKLEAALEQINAAITILDELRLKISSKELRTSYFATVQDRYQFKTDLLMQLHQKHP
jgi:tetratricopeptide (TPR) repeat protein